MFESNEMKQATTVYNMGQTTNSPINADSVTQYLKNITPNDIQMYARWIATTQKSQNQKIIDILRSNIVTDKQMDENVKLLITTITDNIENIYKMSGVKEKLTQREFSLLLMNLAWELFITNKQNNHG